MKKKINKKIIIIVFAFVILLLCSYGVYRHFNVPYKNLDLNYKELNEDIKSIKKGEGIKHATLVETDTEVKPYYEGEGYVIQKLYGGECIDYVIYHNGKTIWEYTQIIPLKEL